VTVAVRDPPARDLLAAAARLDVTVTLTGFDTPQGGAPDILISTVPAGAGDLCQTARGDLVPRHLLDVVTTPGRPPWPTPPAVVRAAGGFGCSCTRP
jgi:hypothetical protein